MIGMIGRWKRIPAGMTPGGCPVYVCGNCGKSEHLHGVEFPKRKVVCDGCGRVNIYPHEQAYEEGTSLWQQDGERDG